MSAARAEDQRASFPIRGYAVIALCALALASGVDLAGSVATL